MGATQKLAIRDAGGKVIAIDVTRRFAPEAWAAADHAETLLNAINPIGFVPFGDKGEPFDPPEEWPSDKTATEYAPEAVPGEYATQAVTPKTHFNGIPIRLPDGHLNPVAISAVIRKVRADKMPPNCDGNAQYGHEPTQSGQMLAHAMHTAAEGGEGCDSVACSITQGVSD